MSDALPVASPATLDARYSPRDGSPMGQRDEQETVQETTEIQEEDQEVICLGCGAKAADGWYLCLDCLEAEEREIRDSHE